MKKNILSKFDFHISKMTVIFIVFPFLRSDFNEIMERILIRRIVLSLVLID